jgi:hypothetical protein
MIVRGTDYLKTNICQSSLYTFFKSNIKNTLEIFKFDTDLHPIIFKKYTLDYAYNYNKFKRMIVLRKNGTKLFPQKYTNGSFTRYFEVDNEDNEIYSLEEAEKALEKEIEYIKVLYKSRIDTRINDFDSFLKEYDDFCLANAIKSLKNGNQIIRKKIEDTILMYKKLCGQKGMTVIRDIYCRETTKDFGINNLGKTKYQEKYLKYKNKYLSLKKQLGDFNL